MQFYQSLYDDKMFNQPYLSIFDDVSSTYNPDIDTNEFGQVKGTDTSYSVYQDECIIDDHIEYMEDSFIMGDHFSSSTDSASLDIDSPHCMDYNSYSPNSTPSSPDSSLTHTSQTQYPSHTNSPNSHSHDHLSHTQSHISPSSLDSQTNYPSPHNSHENESSKPSSYFLFSQFKQDQLQEIMKQQQKEKEMNKEQVLKEKTYPVIKPSDCSDIKIAPQSFVISEIPYNESMSRKGFQQGFIPNQSLGHVAIATIAQNNFPLPQENTIIAIHPVQTFYPFTSSQITSILNSPHINSDFKYFDGMKSRKRCRMNGTSTEKERRVRPKVIPEKGAIQCKGYNRKKKTQCKNAALMEYIGPRPLYCAEHIDLDPDCLYTKCKSPFNKTREDEKGCREVVLKEFTFCHKHYYLAVEEMATKGEEGRKIAESRLERAKTLLKNLETEAIKAKRTDPDLFQRKHKLIPKFHQIIRTLQKFLQTN